MIHVNAIFNSINIGITIFFYLLEKYLPLFSYEYLIEEHVCNVTFSICLYLAGLKRLGRAGHVYIYTQPHTQINPPIIRFLKIHAFFKIKEGERKGRKRSWGEGEEEREGNESSLMLISDGNFSMTTKSK